MEYFEKFGHTFALDTDSYIVYKVHADNFLEDFWQFENFGDFLLQIDACTKQFAETGYI